MYQINNNLIQCYVQKNKTPKIKIIKNRKVPLNKCFMQCLKKKLNINCHLIINPLLSKQ